jgi:uncharacterized protein YfkK (UPF0435 family)
MLTKYSLDTNDEDIGKSAIELRKRFAGRKLEKDLSTGAIDDKLLIQFKEMNRYERFQHSADTIEIMEQIQGNRQTLVRTEQQLEIQSQLRLLNQDITRSTRLSKAKVDSLTDLEKRIRKLRQNLSDPQPVPGVEHVVIEQLTSNNKIHLEKLFKQCSNCSRNILVGLHDAHHTACLRMNGQSVINSRPPIYDVDVDLKTSLTSFLPQSPRNCRLVSRGYRYLAFSWDPPVFDGGLPITNYQLSYKTHTVTFDPGTKMKIVKVKECPLVNTSYWCVRNPVCHHGFKLTGLTGGQSYVDLRVRSVNLRGVSEWVDLIPSTEATSTSGIVATLAPIAPWEPLFVHVAKVTSSCIHLDWEPPFFDGGSEIVRYEIKYVVYHRTVTSTNRAHLTAREYTVKTPVVQNTTPRYTNTPLSFSLTHSLTLCLSLSPLSQDL